VISSIVEFKDKVLAPYNGLKVTWFGGWHSALDDALQSLPELDACPHELFRLLVQNPVPSRKRTALISDHGTPVAVVGLRQKGRISWEPVMQWIIPGEPFPYRPGYLMRVFEVLNREIWVAWWRANNPPRSQLIRSLESTPTYRMSCHEDIEQYWRDNGYFKTIRRVRNRCKDYVTRINESGSAEWTIKGWEEKWRSDPARVDPSLSDRILAAKYLEALGRYYTITLFDQDVLIGGATMTVHRNDLVAGVLYNDPQYRRNGIGDRLIDLSFSFAIEKGFETFDIGGGHEYKKNWAKQDGERWWFHVCPEPLYRFKETVQWGRKSLRRGAEEQPRTSNID
jgi:hypothetical protein